MHIHKFKVPVLLAALVTIGSALSAQNASKAADPATENHLGKHLYDPARDAGADIEQAVDQARKTDKSILLEVGGDWCPWCHKLDEFFQNHSDVRELRDAHFIVVNVYYGTDNKNEKVLAPYSKILGIPHLFVLDKNGNLLYSQHAVELQTGGDYDPDKMKQFLTKWSPSSNSAASIPESRAR